MSVAEAFTQKGLREIGEVKGEVSTVVRCASETRADTKIQR